VEIFEKIKTYIPQADPFVMVSELVKVDNKGATSKFFISDNNIFSDRGFLDESGIIENIAQTAAAMTGYNTIVNKQKVEKGFIGSLSNVIINELPKSQTEIETTIVVENVVMGVHIIKGIVMQDNRVIAECGIKIFFEE